MIGYRMWAFLFGWVLQKNGVLCAAIDYRNWQRPMRFGARHNTTRIVSLIAVSPFRVQTHALGHHSVSITQHFFHNSVFCAAIDYRNCQPSGFGSRRKKTSARNPRQNNAGHSRRLGRWSADHTPLTVQPLKKTPLQEYSPARKIPFKKTPLQENSPTKKLPYKKTPLKEHSSTTNSPTTKQRRLPSTIREMVSRAHASNSTTTRLEQYMKAPLRPNAGRKPRSQRWSPMWSEPSAGYWAAVAERRRNTNRRRQKWPQAGGRCGGYRWSGGDEPLTAAHTDHADASTTPPWGDLWSQSHPGVYRG